MIERDSMFACSPIFRLLLPVILAICGPSNAQEPDREPDDPAERLHLPVPEERNAVAAIRQYGGWYQVDDDNHVVEVNLVCHYTDDGTRYDNEQVETDKALEWLPSFPRLRYLFLRAGQATDDGMQLVAELQDLEEIYAWDAQELTDAGVEHLRELKKLRRIHVSRSQIGDGALEVFGELPELEFLAIQFNKFTDQGFEHLVGLEKLTHLFADREELVYSDVALRHIGRIHSLEALSLFGCRVSNTGIRHLRELSHLQHVEFGNREPLDGLLNDDCIVDIVRFRDLRGLNLGYTTITADGLQRLLEMPELEFVALASPAILPEVMEEFQRQYPEKAIELHQLP